MTDKIKLERLGRIMSIEQNVRAQLGIKDGIPAPDIIRVYMRSLVDSIRQLDLEASFDCDELYGIEERSDYDTQELYWSALKVLNSVRIEKERISVEVMENANYGMIEIDHDWKAQIQSYLEHIRNIVRSADLRESIRESILSKVSSISSDVEKNKTSLEKIGEAWVEATAYFGAGAENLKPAVELLERLAKALGKLRDATSSPKLPSPKQARLPAPEDNEGED